MPLFRGAIRPSSIFLALAILAAPTFGQSTGRLAGHIHDENEVSLPGATIIVSSPNLMGSRTEFGDADGNFSFHNLPPGVYAIDVELEGFLPQRRSEVEVRLNRVTEIHIDLEPGEFSGEITVVAETPMVDPEQVSTSQTFSSEHIKESSIGSLNRRYYSVLAQAPGVVQTTSVNPHVFGSTVAENVYYIDSIDSTDPVTSTVGIHVNFDAIQEINLETGGFEARYGRATGGVINVVTRSGGNDLAGTLDVRYRDTDFNTNADRFTSEEATSRQDEDVSVLSAEVLGLSSSNLEWHIAASTSRGNLDVVPQSGDFDTIGHFAIGRGFVETVNYTELRLTERDRDELSASAAWFSGHTGGDHELRLGVGVRRRTRTTGSTGRRPRASDSARTTASS